MAGVPSPPSASRWQYVSRRHTVKSGGLVAGRLPAAVASCAQMADIGVTIGVAEPTDRPADAIRGTIVLHSGGQGTGFSNLAATNVYLAACSQG
jgi:hypothetical protein